MQIARKLDEDFKKFGLTGSLHGIPVLLKDNCETIDMPTTAGSKSLEGWQTNRDAFLANRIREAGGIILAKTNLHEFAVWGETISSILGQTLNPYDLSRTPGGSSGGSGAAIAANFGLVAIGTDTINSIRSPASACSLCGIRPTIGLVSGFGIVPYSLTQDTAGPIARTVTDAVKLLDVISGYDEQDPQTEIIMDKTPCSYTNYLDANKIKSKRIGVLQSFFGKDEINQPVNEVIDNALVILKNAGAELVAINDEIDSQAMVQEISVHLYDLKAHLGEYLLSFGDNVPVHSIDEILQSGKYTQGIEDNLKIANTLSITTQDYTERLDKRDDLISKLTEILDIYAIDAICFPHQQQIVCKTGASQKQRNGALASITGFPSIVVPAGFTAPDTNAPIGVPVGIEFVGRPLDEGNLIEIVYGFEQFQQMRKQPTL